MQQVMQSSSISARKVNPAAANEQQRRDFMAAYGWEVQEEPLEIREVLIPGQFDEAYEKYNYIQKQQGFDLSRYRGKVCPAGMSTRCRGIRAERRRCASRCWSTRTG